MRTLESGTILNNKYRIESVLGEGGFGITYLATDTVLNEQVAIKEYFPSNLGTRDVTDGQTQSVSLISQDHQPNYEKGLARFEEEAANLAKFNKESGIVSVKNFFKENNTGYMVMEYLKGVTLKKFISNMGGKLTYERTISMMEPIMNSLSKVHSEGIIHRDISPDNIMVTQYGEVKLIDFGAARYVGNEDEKSLSVMLKMGYAPVEQYDSKGDQGPWTDVYALCATMYYMVTGKKPPESLSRKAGAEKLEKLTDVPKNFAVAIEKGMAVDVNDRCLSIEELKHYMAGKRNTKKIITIVTIAVVTMVVIIVAIVLIFVTGTKKNTGSKSSVDSDKKEQVEVSVSESASADKSEETASSVSVSEPEVFEPFEAYVINGGYLCTLQNGELYLVKYKDNSHVYYFECERGASLKVIGEYDDCYTIVNDFDKDIVYKTHNEDQETIIHDIFDDVLYIHKNNVIPIEDKEDFVKALNLVSANVSLKESNRYSNTNYKIWYDDLDGDGSKDLIVEVAVGQMGYVFYSNGSDIKKYVCTNNTAENTSPYEMTVFNMGKNKIIKTGFWLPSAWEQNDYFVLDNGNFIKIDVEHISDMYGWVGFKDCFDDSSTGLGDVVLYKNNGETKSYYTETDIVYPIWYQGGKISEVASCNISENDFNKFTGSDKVMAQINNEMQTVDFWFYRDGSIFFDCEDIEIESILYNDFGFIAMNIFVDVKLIPEDKLPSKYADYDLAHDYSAYDNVSKIPFVYYISVENGEVKIIDHTHGTHKPSSGKYDILKTSSFNY